MNYKVLALTVSMVLASAGGIVYAETREAGQRQTRTKEEICLDLLARADEKAQNKQEYLDRIDEAFQKLADLEVPADAGVDPGLIEEKKAQAEAKAQELRAKVEELYAVYASVKPEIDCSNPEEALQIVKDARAEMQGGSFISKYVGDLNISELNAQAKTVREQVVQTLIF